ncbi:hypothetical protein D3C80_2054730 [compost metagenome]
MAPDSASASARLTETVDLPTPPLPEPTAITCLMPAGRFAWSAAPVGTFAPKLMVTSLTPGICDTAAVASLRI